jgi:hypothetical protein
VRDLKLAVVCLAVGNSDKCWGSGAGSCLVCSYVSEACTPSVFRVTESSSGGC